MDILVILGVAWLVFGIIISIGKIGTTVKITPGGALVTLGVNVFLISLIVSLSNGVI